KVCRMPILERFPMKPDDAEGANANEYPQKYHCTVTTASAPEHAAIMARADLRRARPAYRKPRPGTISSTMAALTITYAWSPAANHLFTFSIPNQPVISIAAISDERSDQLCCAHLDHRPARDPSSEPQSRRGRPSSCTRDRER